MIENPLDELRQRLMSYEPADTELGERYRREIETMLHRGRGRVRRWIQIMTGIAFVVLPLFCVLIVPRLERTPSPPFARAMMIVGGGYMGIMGVAFLACGIRDIDPRRYRALWHGLGTCFVSLLAAALLNESWRTQDATLRWQLTEVAFVFLGLVGVSTIIHFIEDYYKRTELKLLQLEYRLADMASQMRKGVPE